MFSYAELFDSGDFDSAVGLFAHAAVSVAGCDFQARGAAFDAVCRAADELRQRVNGDVVSYVVTQGVSQSEADAWADDLRAVGARGNYFFSLNEYIFTADKP